MTINLGWEPAESPADLARRLDLPFSDMRLLTRALTRMLMNTMKQYRITRDLSFWGMLYLILWLEPGYLTIIPKKQKEN